MGTVLDTVTYTYGDSNWGDLLTGYDGKTITYDTIGNPLSDGTWTYTWEHGRELASMSNGSTTWSYEYNADGLRTKRTNGSTTYSYIYNGSSLSRMTVGSNTLYFAYDATGTPMSVTYNDTVYYYVTNIQGDITAILNTSGTAVVQYTYDAWGNILTTTGSMASTLGETNPLRYRGYVYDRETRLYYLQSRYYDPEIGRFINADAFASTGQGVLGNHMFAYCSNNPIMRADPAGEFWWIIPVIVIPLLLTGCSKESDSPREVLANAPDLDVSSAPNYSYNCYGNAICKQIVADPSGYTKGDSVEKTFAAVQRDLGGEANCKRLDSYSSQIEEGWYVVAMMCGKDDYHFIRQDEKGWYNKSGYDPSLGGCYIYETLVHANVWYAVGILNGEYTVLNWPGCPVYYNEEGPLYFAVRIGWDK